MKTCLSLLATLVLAVGCKTDSESKAGSPAPAAEQSASHTGRSGKIEMPQRRRPTLGDDVARPGLPDGDSMTREERQEQRRARREERRKERIAELDKNGDGQIDDAERDAARKDRMDEMRTRMDTNGDGKLTVDELQNSRGSRRFGDVSAIDLDKNGEISAEEMQKQMETMRARGWGRRGGWRGGDGQGSGSAAPAPSGTPETR